MASDVIVPEVGELGMEVIFVRWLKAVGDEVSIGDPLFEVDTEKSVVVVEAYAAGTLVDLRAGEGDNVAPRAVIGRILHDGETAEPPESKAAAAASATITPDAVPAPGASTGIVASSAISATSPGATATAGSSWAPGRVSPRARRAAKELGVDPSGLNGSGPNGLITEADIRAAADPGTAGADHAPVHPNERTRKAIADLTTASWQTIPHFYLELEANVEAGLGLAKPTPLVCASVAQALVRHPECNLVWDGDRPVQRPGVDLGLLVDAPVGLLIAVITDAQELDLADMAEAIRGAAARALNSKLSAADMGPRSLTVSNLGMYSVDRFTAVIPKPDVLTLAVSRTRTVPRWQGSAFAPARVMDLTLSVDHRALNGAAAARFMTSLEAILGDPAAEGLA